MSVGDGDARGPWNNEPTFDFREATPAVDGGSGMPEVTMSSDEAEIAAQAAARLASDPASDPVTGAMLGMTSADELAAGTSDPKAAKKVASKAPRKSVKAK
jgi:Mn-containing catalase